jgi:hypothetical protein
MSLASRLALAATVAATAAVAVPTTARAGSGTDLVKYMPEDASIIMVVDIAGARGSDLFKQAMNKFMSSNAPGLAQLRASGIDPATAFDTLAFGGVGSLDHLDPDGMVVVAEGSAVQKVVAEMAKAKAGAVQVQKYHGVKYWTSGDGAFAVVHKRLVVAKPAGIHHAIDLALGRGRNAARSSKARALRAVISATDTRHHLWAAAVLPPEASAQAKAAAGVDMKGVSFGATLTSSLRLEVRILTGDAKSAAKAVGLINTQLPALTQQLSQMGLGGAAKTISITSDGATIKATVSLTEGEIRSLAGLLGGLTGLGGGTP